MASKLWCIQVAYENMHRAYDLIIWTNIFIASMFSLD